MLPFFHGYGMTMMNSVLRRGTTCVTMPRFELGPFLSVIEHHRVTILNLVPPIVLALAKHPAVANHECMLVSAPEDAELVLSSS